MKKSNGFTNFLNSLFPAGTRLGMIISLIIGLIGCIFSYILRSHQYVILFFQVVVTIIITAILSNIINRYQHETIESATDILLKKIEKKYKNFSSYPTNLFKIFQLNDGGNFYNVAHNIFFNKLIDSYSRNGENRKYYIPIDTYNEVIKEILEIGEYKLKIINGLLLPFWYAPKEKDAILTKYMEFCKSHPQLFKRVTYYQDYEGDSWRDDTVRMIYNDLKSSEKSDDIAVKWLITLIVNIKELKNKFGNEIKGILGEELRNIDYLHHKDVHFNEAIRKNISNVEKFLKKKYGTTTISCEMTTIINNLFKIDMKENSFIKKSEIDSMFRGVINFEFEEVTEVGYYYKEEEGNEYDQFVMLLNGRNTGPSVEIQIIIAENEDARERIIKIQKRLFDLFNDNAMSPKLL